MSTERDTHFQNFARLLWDELVRANEQDDMCGFIDVNVDDDGIDPTDYRTIIARRAYDLVEHTLKEVNPHHLDGFSPLEWAVQSVPDMTSFPEQTQQ